MPKGKYTKIAFAARTTKAKISHNFKRTKIMKTKESIEFINFQISDKVYWIGDKNKEKLVMVVHAIDEDTKIITCQFKDTNNKFDTANFHYKNLIKVDE